MPERLKGIDFSDWSGGKNSTDPQHALRPNQVRDTINLIHEKIGGSRAPGYIGISTTPLFTSQVYGAFAYKTNAGNEYLICVSDGKVYNVTLSNGTKTQIGTMAGSGTAYAVNAAGKLWIVNGTSFVKVESDLSVYQVGITAPSGASAAAQAGGTLPDGDYIAYVSYARKDASGRYLYSYPESLGTVTLGSGNNTVRFTINASADTQVNYIVFWLSDAGGATPYYYGEVANTNGPHDVTDNSDRNSLIRMDIEAAPNTSLPINPSKIFFFDDQLIVWSTDTFYWSLRTDINPFDMERFVSENFRTVSVIISSMFSCGLNDDLFINSVKNGIFKLPNGDFSSVIRNVNKRYWFNEAYTEEGAQYVINYNNIAFGYTNDGIRYFNGEMFSDDLSFNIKSDIDNVNSGVSSTYPPAIMIFRRKGKRTELRFSYRDLNNSTTLNNKQLVLNIDKMFDSLLPEKCWEVWDTGFFAYVIIGENICCLQRKNDGVVALESGVSDNYIYNKTAAYLSTLTSKGFYLQTRTVLDRIDTISIWGSIYALATSSGPISGNFILFDAGNSKVPFTLTGTEAPVAVLPADGLGGLAMPFILTGEFPTSNIHTMPYDARSSYLAIEISQDYNDRNFRVYNIILPRRSEISHNLT